MILVRRAYELGLFALCAVVLARRSRVRGLASAVREILFGFVLSQGVELLAVARGRYAYPDWLIYFPPAPRWVPLAVGLGWASLLPIVMRVSESILGERASRARLAALDGAIAVGLDLVLDPAVSGEPLAMWRWSGAGMTPYRLWVLGVPAFNFVGWFLLVAACGYQLRATEAIADRGARRRRMLAFLASDALVALAAMELPW